MLAQLKKEKRKKQTCASWLPTRECLSFNRCLGEQHVNPMEV